MNNASLHVCVSIIQTNHYIYSIIFIMNNSPAWRQTGDLTDVLGCEDKWQDGDLGD